MGAKAQIANSITEHEDLVWVGTRAQIYAFNKEGAAVFNFEAHNGDVLCLLSVSSRLWSTSTSSDICVWTLVPFFLFRF